jgi:hypothetical protein
MYKLATPDLNDCLALLSLHFAAFRFADGRHGKYLPPL